MLWRCCGIADSALERVMELMNRILAFWHCCIAWQGAFLEAFGPYTINPVIRRHRYPLVVTNKGSYSFESLASLYHEI